MTAGRYIENQPISWERMHQDARELARRVADLGPFKGIMAVARGGLTPAAVLARELGIRLVHTLCISSYDWKNPETKARCLLKTLEGDGEGWLIVDDLVDTGRTAMEVRKMYPKGLFVTLYAKPEGRPHVDICISEVAQNTWILLPWDSDSQLDFVPPLVESAFQK